MALLSLRRWCAVSILSLFGACHHSGSSGTSPVLASALIGPAGGVLVVNSGRQAGLQLVVPAGAVAATQEVRVLDGYAVGVGAVSQAIVPGDPFVLEPRGLTLAQPATLRAPYRTNAVTNTAPGNVRARRTTAESFLDYTPIDVDVAAGLATFELHVFGRIQVVAAGAVQPNDYRPATGTVALVGGGSFTVEDAPATGPFASIATQRWHLQFGSEDVSFYFADTNLVGRATPQWSEVWDTPYFVWQNVRLGQIYGADTDTQVSNPLGVPPLGGHMIASASWSWADPALVGSELVLDVIRLRFDLTWNRGDLGIGQSQLVFAFSPGRGLVSLRVDGVDYPRAP